MKKLNFDVAFKIIIMVSLGYSLCLLTIIANNSGVGRYQIAPRTVIDTKTGKFYLIKPGQQIEYEKLNEK